MTKKKAKSDGTFEVLVEIPRGSRSKYELDEKSGRLRLKEVLSSSVHYPTDYGFILDTLADDGDHLDVLLLVEEPALPGSVQTARPIGVLDMADKKGDDQKILAVPIGDPRFDEMQDLKDLPEHWKREITAFFGTYRLLDKANPEIRGWRGKQSAWQIVEQARSAYADRNNQRS